MTPRDPCDSIFYGISYWRLCLDNCSSDALELVQMQYVMAGVKLELVRQAFLASLHVNSDTLQVLRCGAVNEAEVTLPEN